MLISNSNINELRKLLETLRNVELAIISAFLSNIFKVYLRFSIAIPLGLALTLMLTEVPFITKLIPDPSLIILSLWVLISSILIYLSFRDYNYYVALARLVRGSRVGVKKLTLTFLVLTIALIIVVIWVVVVITSYISIPSGHAAVLVTLIVVPTGLLISHYALIPRNVIRHGILGSPLIASIPMYVLASIALMFPGHVGLQILAIILIAILILYLGYDVQKRARVWLAKNL